MIALLIFTAFEVVSVGYAAERSRPYAEASAQYNAATELAVQCAQRGGDAVKFVRYGEPVCEATPGAWACKVAAVGTCTKEQP